MNRSDLTLIIVGVILVAAGAVFTFFQVNQGAGIDEDALNRMHYEKALRYFEMERFAEAIQEFDQIEPATSANWKVHYYRGSTLIKLERYDAAIDDLEKSFELNADESSIPFAIGVAYYKLGKLGMAEGYFRAALELDPNNEDARGLMNIMTNLQRQQPGERSEPSPAHTQSNDN